jgi:hypothetical protein
MLETRGKGSGKAETGDQRSIRENEGEEDLKPLDSKSHGNHDVLTVHSC